LPGEQRPATAPQAATLARPRAAPRIRPGYEPAARRRQVLLDPRRGSGGGAGGIRRVESRPPSWRAARRGGYAIRAAVPRGSPSPRTPGRRGRAGGGLRARAPPPPPRRPAAPGGSRCHTAAPLADERGDWQAPPLAVVP